MSADSRTRLPSVDAWMEQKVAVWGAAAVALTQGLLSGLWIRGGVGFLPAGLATLSALVALASAVKTHAGARGVTISSSGSADSDRTDRLAWVSSATALASTFCIGLLQPTLITESVLGVVVLSAAVGPLGLGRPSRLVVVLSSAAPIAAVTSTANPGNPLIGLSVAAGVLLVRRGLDSLLAHHREVAERQRVLLESAWRTRREVEETRRHLEDLALRDELTGCWNRRRLKALRHELEAKSAIWGCLYLDLDRFKEVNDRQGHTAGDRVLVRFSHFLNHHRRADDLLFRIGGDEFLMIFTRVTPDDLAVIEQRILSAQCEAPCTFSSGSAYRSAHEDVETVIRRADEAMYQAKWSSGANGASAEPAGLPS